MQLFCEIISITYLVLVKLQLVIKESGVTVGLLKNKYGIPCVN